MCVPSQATLPGPLNPYEPPERVCAQLPSGSAISLVNCGLEGFTRAAALEAPRGIRVNVVSPPWVTETLIAMGSTDLSHALPAATVARAYVRSVTGNETGQVIEP